MIKILHIISPGTGNFGGIESYLYEYYKHIDHDKVRFDFAFCAKNTMKLKQQEETFLSSKFIEMECLSREHNRLLNWLKLGKKIRTIAKEGQYDYVETHTSAPMIQAISALALKREKCIKIAHSHAMTSIGKDWKHKLINGICSRIIVKNNDFLFSCSYAAGAVFGEKGVQSDKFRKINNAIEAEKYRYDRTMREKIRRENNITDDCLVVGHVARLAKEKNQVFLVDVFYHIHKEIYNSVLWIIGAGETREKIVKRIQHYGIESAVKMMGERKDVDQLLQGMDLFIVPSIKEGLCISAIESQAAGLPTFVSTGIPDECKITNHLEFLSLADGAEKWAKLIIESIRKMKREDLYDDVIKNGYDVTACAKELQEFYIEQYDKDRKRCINR